MSKQTFLDYAETKKGSILLSSVSVSNNILSAINATDTVADNEKMSETERAITLAVFDVIGIVGKFLGESKIGKGLNVVSWGAEAGLVGHRLFFKNLPDYNAHRDFNSDTHKAHKGYIPLTLIYDIIADTAKLAEKLSDMARVLAKIPTTPASIILNVASALITQVSASLAIQTNNIEIKPEYLEEYKNADDAGREIIRQKLAGLMVHKDDFSFAEALSKAMIHVLTNKEALFGVLEKIIHQSIPDILNPFDKPREDELIGTLGDDVIDANSFFDDPYMMMGHDGNDTLIGGSRDDHLDGGNGNDVLKGNGGNDEMRGEQGYDTYHIKDHDTIYDADGKGQIIFDGKALPKEFIKQEGINEIWEAKDSTGKVIYTAVRGLNDLVISSVNSPADLVRIKDFFLTAKTSGTTYSALSIVLGNSKEEINKEGIYTIKTDDKLHANVYAGAFPSEFIEVIGSDKIDWINAGNVNKQLDVTTEGGNDFIFGGNMGDVIKAGVGNDVIYGSSGFYDFADESKLPKPEKEGEGIDEDLLIGGAGNDLISGGLGNDIIWADDEYKGDGKTPLHMDTSNPHNKNNPSEKGDWILGGRGNDFIHGSTNNDFLQGGADKDTIYGGGGNDVILGDGHIRFGNRTQTITSESTISYDPTLIGSGMISTTPTIHHGVTLSMEYNYDNKNGKELNTKQQFVNLRDHRVFSWDIEINTEQGDYKFTKQKDITLTDDYHLLDEKFTQNTSDLLYGGAGNDLIIGQYGNDYIDGGAGNDIIYGDDNRNPNIGMADGQLVDVHDTLKGGTGLDKLLGGLGDDVYLLDLDDLATSNDNKIIEDSDSRGMLVVDGTSWEGKVWTQSIEQENIYLDGQGNTLQKQGSDYVITSTNFVASISIQKTTLVNHTLLGMTLQDTPPDEPKPSQPEAPKPNTPPPAPETPPNTPSIPTTGNPATPEAPITADPNTPITPVGADPITPNEPTPPATEPTTPTTPIDPVTTPILPPSTPITPIAVIPPTPTYNPTKKGKTVWGSLGHDNLMGDDNANTLLGLLGDDTLNGGLGHDRLYGDLGHDTLIGGKDNDWLEGGFGNDIYLYTKGDGKDTIKDIGGLDMLKITGLSLSDLGFVKQGDHLFIDTNLNDNSTNEGIFIENYFQKNFIDMMTGRTPTPTIERLYVDDKLVSHHEIHTLTQVL